MYLRLLVMGAFTFYSLHTLWCKIVWHKHPYNRSDVRKNFVTIFPPRQMDLASIQVLLAGNLGWVTKSHKASIFS